MSCVAVRTAFFPPLSSACSLWLTHFPSKVLPSNRGEVLESAIPPAEVTKVALRLKYQIEQVIPCQLEVSQVTRANSPVITRNVLDTAKEAGGEEFKSCVVYCLLVCRRWFRRQAVLELWDADLHNLRAVACEVLAKQMYFSLCPLSNGVACRCPNRVGLYKVAFFLYV